MNHYKYILTDSISNSTKLYICLKVGLFKQMQINFTHVKKLKWLKVIL